jgi:peptidoglycan/LPS O-acetylase OafA/YrhL
MAVRPNKYEPSLDGIRAVAMTRQGHLYLLDILRGLASLAVVVFHYQHFYFVGSSLPGSFSTSREPFYAFMSIFYNDGWRAVELFFVLSGFIFFYQYEEQIRRRSVGRYKFFVLRFSRLYPLHFVTLLLVAAGQLISTAIDGQPVVYACNDVPRFEQATGFRAVGFVCHSMDQFGQSRWKLFSISCFSFSHHYCPTDGR